MKRKLGILALAVFFILTSAVTGTLANAAEVKATENTVTSGENVIIEQGVYARGTDWTSLFVDDTVRGNVKYTDCGELHVAVYGECFNWESSKMDYNWTDSIKVALWDESKISNVKDQMVSVENVGSQDAYVRTVFAFEADTTQFDNLIHMNWNLTGITLEHIGQTKIEEKLFDLYVATYDAVLQPDKTSAPSLLQIAMDKGAGNAQMTQFGDKYEIMYVSQAVATDIVSQENQENSAQAALNKAFGEITKDKHPWSSQETAGN